LDARKLLGVDFATIQKAAANLEPQGTTQDPARLGNGPHLFRRPWMRSPPPRMLLQTWPGDHRKGELMPATTPEQIHRLFEEAFNAGDLDALMELYESDAALIAQPGSVAHGREQARAALQGFLALKGRITLDTKLVVTVGELAYLANTWSLTGTGADGNPVVLGATTAEVARRQADGGWRYVIDNAWGDQAVAD
jgi:uncharacterized protein (TIGR02246 family)